MNGRPFRLLPKLMKAIEYKWLSKIIKIGKIKPFNNVCKVTGQCEDCNVEVTYIPNNKVIELGSYRKYFEQWFNLYIEELADKIFEDIYKLIDPVELKVEVFLTQESLTPWSVLVSTQNYEDIF